MNGDPVKEWIIDRTYFTFTSGFKVVANLYLQHSEFTNQEDETDLHDYANVGSIETMTDSKDDNADILSLYIRLDDK